MYDEFGNYIGPEMDMSEDSADEDNERRERDDRADGRSDDQEASGASSNYAYEKPVSKPQI